MIKTYEGKFKYNGRFRREAKIGEIAAKLIK